LLPTGLSPISTPLHSTEDIWNASCSTGKRAAGAKSTTENTWRDFASPNSFLYKPVMQFSLEGISAMTEDRAQHSCPCEYKRREPLRANDVRATSVLSNYEPSSTTAKPGAYVVRAESSIGREEFSVASAHAREQIVNARHRVRYLSSPAARIAAPQSTLASEKSNT
jgi:hypothetical protein